jgi:hypothetical protein
MRISRGTRTPFLVDESRSALLTDIAIANVSSHFNLHYFIGVQ